MSIRSDLQKFFEEKQLPSESFSIEHNDTTHHIDTEFLIDQILNHTSEEDQGVIRGSLFQLDRRNLAISDYLRFLAEEYIKNNY
ncbi:hypothetical protein [Paenibacillus polymyxa]|uniref:hypothetical protein n=1 Tax=Paenibacillus polymyxa TaxID=1406 RepID=UPI0025B72F90|nr:hypothetical protein [Paenibacillus polymyxa]MDN4090909.1 hypothetical protein [Paenibacillus polymyxa]